MTSARHAVDPVWLTNLSEDGRVYYYHRKSHETSWDHPLSAALQSSHEMVEAIIFASRARRLETCLWVGASRATSCAFRHWRDLASRGGAGDVGVVVPRIAAAMDAYMRTRDLAQDLRQQYDELVVELVVERLRSRELVSSLVEAKTELAAVADRDLTTF